MSLFSRQRLPHRTTRAVKNAVERRAPRKCPDWAPRAPKRDETGRENEKKRRAKGQRRRYPSLNRRTVWKRSAATSRGTQTCSTTTWDARQRIRYSRINESVAFPNFKCFTLYCISEFNCLIHSHYLNPLLASYHAECFFGSFAKLQQYIHQQVGCKRQ